MSRKAGATTSLSNGTLSLRFMQRGGTQRVTAASAKVVDEAEWDIGPAARAAWGVPSNELSSAATQQTSIHVISDDSYLPFMFDQDTPTSAGQQPSSSELESEPARRRVFRKGTEVTREDSSQQQDNAKDGTEKEEGAADRDVKPSGASNTTKTQPKSISGSKTTTGPQVANKPGMRRHRLEGLFKPAGAPATGFLKPAGVSAAPSGTGAKRRREDDTSSQDRTGGKVTKTA